MICGKKCRSSEKRGRRGKKELCEKVAVDEVGGGTLRSQIMRPHTLKLPVDFPLKHTCASVKNKNSTLPFAFSRITSFTDHKIFFLPACS